MERQILEARSSTEATDTGRDSVFIDVTCVSSDDCWAVGAAQGTERTAFAPCRALEWRQVVDLPRSTVVHGYLLGVSCSWP